MSNRYFFVSAAAFYSGTAVGVLYAPLLSILFYATALGLLLGAIGRKRNIPVLLLMCVAVLVATFGAAAAVRQISPLIVSGEETIIEGVVVREVERRERTAHVYIRTETALLLAYADRATTVQYGDRVLVAGELEEPAVFVTDLGRNFNYPGFLEAKGVRQVLYYPELEVMRVGEGNWLLRTLYSFKSAFREKLQLLLPPPHSSLAEGILLGVNGVLGEYWEEVFRRSGIIHIVVLSGYNIMLVVLFVKYVLSFFLPYRARLIVGIGAIVLFALLVGLSATVLRASVMAVLLLLLQFGGNTTNVLRGLALAGAVMLLWNPLLLIYDPGFQLSFLATAGLILLAPKLQRLVRFMPERFLLREFLVATLATQVFVLPFLLYQIGEVSLVAIIVNVLVLPFVSLAMLLSFCAGAIAFISLPLAEWVGYVAYAVLHYILRVSELFSTLPLASIAVPPFPLWVVGVLYIALGYGLWRANRPARYAPHWTIDKEEEVRRNIKTAR